MINIGDTVKVISPTQHGDDMVTFYPIGTICTVVDKESDGSIGILQNGIPDSFPYYYLENELEKGHFEWIKE